MYTSILNPIARAFNNGDLRCMLAFSYFQCLYFTLLHFFITPITIEIRKYCNRQTNGVHVDEDVEI